jgi:DNA-binding MarR family transcriptional regulator
MARPFAICAWLARREARLAGKAAPDYMLAQASIAGTIIVHTAIRGFAMRPYYKPCNYCMKTSVGYLMRMAINRILPKMEALFQDEELTFSQWTTLVALHSGITTAGDLAHNICHDAGSLTRLIDQMVERGFVARQRSAADRRVVTLALTPHGRELVAAMGPRVMDMWNGLLAGFSHAEVDTLIALLTRLAVTAEGRPREGRRSLLLDTPPILKGGRNAKSKKS